MVRYRLRSWSHCDEVPSMKKINLIMVNYLSKMKGSSTRHVKVDVAELFWSWLGAFLGIATIAGLSSSWFDDLDLMMIIGSFGASAVLLYGVVNGPLSQPRNLLGGHVLSAFIGVTCYTFFPDQLWLASSLAVATALVVMQWTNTLHPPGGATALIAVIGGPKIHSLGYVYVVFPTATGAAMMLVIAVLVNNLSSKRRYPAYWF